MDIRIFEDKAAMVSAMVDLISTKVTDISRSEQSEAIMLSGGSTPMAVYEAIAASSLHAGPNLILFMSDERMAPLDSDKNNFHNTRPMIDSLGAHGVRVQTDLSAEDAANAYEAAIGEFLDMGGTIPLGLLGMGSDGHTASLFSEDDLARGANRLVTHVQRPDGMQGVSVTPDTLQKIEKIIFLIAGEDKAPMVQKLLNEPSEVIAGRAIEYCKDVELWLDCSAHG